MHTPTHAVVNLALLGRKSGAARSWAIAIGGVLPDVPAIAFHVYYRLIRQWPEEMIQGAGIINGWRIATMVLHAFPIWLVVLGVAAWRRSTVATAFAASMLLHAALDFPVHHGDALRHFWPISDWRFISPVSYWDVHFHAAWVRLVELALLLAGSFVLWRRHRSAWLRAALVATNALMAAALLSGRLFWAL